MASRKPSTIVFALDDFCLVLDQGTAGTAGGSHAVGSDVTGDIVCFASPGVLDSRQEP